MQSNVVPNQYMYIILIITPISFLALLLSNVFLLLLLFLFVVDFVIHWNETAMGCFKRTASNVFYIKDIET